MMPFDLLINYKPAFSLKADGKWHEEGETGARRGKRSENKGKENFLTVTGCSSDAFSLFLKCLKQKRHRLELVCELTLKAADMFIVSCLRTRCRKKRIPVATFTHVTDVTCDHICLQVWHSTVQFRHMLICTLSSCQTSRNTSPFCYRMFQQVFTSTHPLIYPPLQSSTPTIHWETSRTRPQA